MELRREAVRARRFAPYRATFLAIIACILLSAATLRSAHAQQANQPGFDPRQTEKYFDDRQSGPDRAVRPPPRTPTLARPDITADRKPLFVLRAISVTGASALPREALAASYRPYLGKMVSQADLAAIAQAISDCYRAAGFHLTRAIVPPQDIEGGRVRIQVIEGSITRRRRCAATAPSSSACRPMFNPVLAEHPSRLATLERQLLLVNNLPGVRIVDSALEEIGGTTGRFRIVVQLKTWHIYTFAGLDNLGSATVGPWQAYATAAFNSYLRPGDTLAVNLSTIANDPRQLGFGRISYDTPVGVDGVRLGGSALYSEVRPGDDRRLFNDITKTEVLRTSRQHRSDPVAALDADADGGDRLQQCQRIQRVRKDLRRPYPHLQPDLRLPAAGRLRRHQLCDADLAPGSRHPRRVAFRRRLTSRATARARISPC